MRGIVGWPLLKGRESSSNTKTGRVFFHLFLLHVSLLPPPPPPLQFRSRPVYSPRSSLERTRRRRPPNRTFSPPPFHSAFAATDTDATFFRYLKSAQPGLNHSEQRHLPTRGGGGGVFASFPVVGILLQVILRSRNSISDSSSSSSHFGRLS